MLDRVSGLIGAQVKRRGEATYFLAFNATNALNYAYLVSMGLLLDTESFGLFGALFGLVYLSSALANTVQVAVARHVAAHSSEGRSLSRPVIFGAFTRAGALAAAVGLIFLALSPVLARALHSEQAPLLWIGLAVPLSLCVATGYGLLQGVQRFAALGASHLANALFRLGIGATLVAAGWGPSGAMAGVAFGYAASGLLALLFANTGRRPDQPASIAIPSAQSLAAILVASIAVAAPTSLDVALVKHFFSAQEAGTFTAVAVLGRVVLFVPLAISLIALPKVAARASRSSDPAPLLWSSLGQTAALAAASALLLALATSGLGWSLVGTDLSGALTPLNWYLSAMSVFALVIASTYYQIGRGNNSYVFAFLAPGIIAQTILIVLIHNSLTTVAQVILVVNLFLLAISLGMMGLTPARVLALSRLLSRRTSHALSD